MRFIWFNLMPWPYLPEDFREKTGRCGSTSPVPCTTRCADTRSTTTISTSSNTPRRSGLTDIGVNEHHANAYGLMPSPNLIAAALARRTRDAALVVLGSSIALYNPPIRVAEEFAMLDCISGGRLVAGFPVGTSMDTNYCYGRDAGD